MVGFFISRFSLRLPSLSSLNLLTDEVRIGVGELDLDGERRKVDQEQEESCSEVNRADIEERSRVDMGNKEG